MEQEYAPFLSLGRREAPIHVEAFINTACPYCVNFFKAADEVLPALIRDGQVRYTIKHYDKPKVRLLLGTIANLFIDYSQPDEAYHIVKSLFDTQKEWVHLDSREIERMMAQEYGRKEERSTMNLSLDITAEALDRDVTAVPTVFINDERFQFDSNGSPAIISKALVEKLREM